MSARDSKKKSKDSKVNGKALPKQSSTNEHEFTGSGKALGGGTAPVDPRAAALAAAEKRQAAAQSHGLGDKKAKELREKPQRDALLAKIAELYAARREEVPIAVNSSGLEGLQRHLEHLQRPPVEPKSQKVAAKPAPAPTRRTSTPSVPKAKAAAQASTPAPQLSQGLPEVPAPSEDNEQASAVEALVAMGFAREEALLAYHVSGGSRETACEFLIQEQIQQDVQRDAAHGQADPEQNCSESLPTVESLGVNVDGSGRDVVMPPALPDACTDQGVQAGEDRAGVTLSHDDLSSRRAAEASAIVEASLLAPDEQEVMHGDEDAQHESRVESRRAGGILSCVWCS